MKSLVAILSAVAATALFPGDQDALQGAWRLADARARMSNEPAMILDGLVDRGRLQIAADTVTMRELGNADAARFVFTLDTISSPRRIMMTELDRPDTVRWTGIYGISGDTLRLSLPVEHYSDRPIPPPSFNAPNTVAYIFRRDRP